VVRLVLAPVVCDFGILFDGKIDSNKDDIFGFF
jgi:hypothetical protein